jgi:cysteine sulfinate desulfinase/cysteine desulfurase-like protein
MGFPDEEARGALRLSLGRLTTDADVESAAGTLREVITRQRQGVEALAGTAPAAQAIPVAEAGA